jgi:hypothetical protein
MASEDEEDSVLIQDRRRYLARQALLGQQGQTPA